MRGGEKREQKANLSNTLGEWQHWHEHPLQESSQQGCSSQERGTELLPPTSKVSREWMLTAMSAEMLPTALVGGCCWQFSCYIVSPSCHPPSATGARLCAQLS